MIAAYPGSFDPLTVAHVAVVAAVVDQLGVDRVDLLISVDPLGKDPTEQVRAEDRLAVIEAVGARRSEISGGTTAHRLIADIAVGYDVIVVGADKWGQVLDPAWYGGSVAARDRALAALPTVAIAPRGADDDVPTRVVPGGPAVVLLDVHPVHRDVSATSVRAGRREWMTPEAVAFDERTGAWSDPARYARWIAG